jgi:hypothetical protein
MQRCCQDNVPHINCSVADQLVGVSNICLDGARRVRVVHKCLENEVNVNFCRQSDRDGGSDSEEEVEENNRERDRGQEGKDDEHQVYQIRNGDDERDVVLVVMDVWNYLEEEEVRVVEELAKLLSLELVFEEFDWKLLENYFGCYRDHRDE